MDEERERERDGEREIVALPGEETTNYMQVHIHVQCTYISTIFIYNKLLSCDTSCIMIIEYTPSYLMKELMKQRDQTHGSDLQPQPTGSGRSVRIYREKNYNVMQ